MCPTGKAWTSRAIGDYQAHTDRSWVSYQTTILDGRELEPVQVRALSISECSNRGTCDRQTGERGVTSNTLNDKGTPLILGYCCVEIMFANNNNKNFFPI